MCLQTPPSPIRPPEQHKVPSVLYGYDATGKEERVLLWLDEVCVCMRALVRSRAASVSLGLDFV